MPKDDAKFFCVRDLREETKKKIKLYAAQQDTTMAQALEQLVELAEAAMAGEGSPAAPKESLVAQYKRERDEKRAFLNSMAAALEPLSAEQREIISEFGKKWVGTLNKSIDEVAVLFVETRYRWDESRKADEAYRKQADADRKLREIMGKPVHSDQ